MLAVLWQESRLEIGAVGRPTRVGRAAGAAQIIASTALDLGVENRFDIFEATTASARYLEALYLRFGSEELALAAYNAGPGAVSKYRGIPPYAETQDYVVKISNHIKRIRHGN